MNVNTVAAPPTMVEALDVPGGIPMGIPLGLDPLITGISPILTQECEEEVEEETEGDGSGSAFSYDEVFPALPEVEALKEIQSSNTLGQWNQRMKLKTTEITQVFRVPVEERKYQEMSGGGGGSSFGAQGQQARICGEIMSKTGATIEISSSKDQSLTIVVTGKEDAVARARKEIVAQLQTQASASIHIPKEHYRFILGKSAKKLLDLELATATKIHIPRPGDNSEFIEIKGTKEGIEKARHEIQLISDEQAKLAMERLNIPKIYHPFIIHQLPHINEPGARINIPPPSVMKDEITVSGEKDAVAIVKDRIMSIYDDKKRNCQTVSVEVKKEQHRYIIGPRGTTLHEILEKTGVSVEMPPVDSNLGTITLRGEQEKLGPALTLVYDKANSMKIKEVNAKSWLHKFIIGKKGAVIKQVVQDFPSVHVELSESEDKIKVEGPHEEVDRICERLQGMVAELMSKYHFDTICVDPKYNRHIIGKSGANVNRLKLELGVQIQIPADNDKNCVIRIEGTPQGVEEAKKELMEMINKMENEVTREIPIEQRFHKTVIGAKGGKIKEIRDKFNQVSITFPEAGVKSDKVLIRGPKQDVDKCYKELAEVNKELIANNFKVEIPIYKQFHKYIIGKGGANVKKIRDETDTRIDLPAEGAESDVIVITGKKENVLEAKEMVAEIQNTMSNIVDVSIIIPARFHNAIIGAKGRLIRSIKEDCGGVTIHFPAEGSGSDKVSIRGPKEDVDKAKKQLVERSNEKQLTGYTEELKARREHHKFLIGKNGANIKKVRDRTGARIIFPTGNDDDQECIIIIGQKEHVLLAKKELSDMIKELDHLVEVVVNVEPKHHRHFVSRRGQILRQIEEDFGGVTVSFPRNGENSDVVILKGAKECVAGAKERILEIVNDLDSRVVVECIIPQQYHRTVMGARGYKVQTISQDFEVHIKFPEREAQPEYAENGDDGQQHFVSQELGEAEQRKLDTILITGQSDKCEAAKEALLALVPTTVDVSVPYDLHRYIIGKKGQGVREMMGTYDVNISVPQATDQCDNIKISGPPANVKAARENLLEKVRQFEMDKQDRALRNFQLSLEVDPKYHPKIIGKGGLTIKKIRSDHNVFIQFQERNHPEENKITVIGYEKNAEAARDEILQMVKEMEDIYEQAIQLDARVHSRLIGARGRNIRRIMDEHKVDIRFPRSTDEDPDTVVVSGLPDRVDEAIDYLRNLEEEYLQDIQESAQAIPSRHADDNDSRPQFTQQGFVVTGGPWEHKRVPDTTSTMEFPSFGSADMPKPVAWGPRQ